MQRYNITELSNKSLDELREIAREIGFSADSFPDKRELIYEILDQQAVTVAETTSVKRKPGRPRKSVPSEAPAGEPAQPAEGSEPATASTSSTPEGEAPKRKRGRPSKAELLARQQAISAVAKASESQEASSDLIPAEEPKAQKPIREARGSSPAPVKTAEAQPRVTPVEPVAPAVNEPEALASETETAPAAAPVSPGRIVFRHKDSKSVLDQVLPTFTTPQPQPQPKVRQQAPAEPQPTKQPAVKATTRVQP